MFWVPWLGLNPTTGDLPGQDHGQDLGLPETPSPEPAQASKSHRKPIHEISFLPKHSLLLMALSFLSFLRFLIHIPQNPHFDFFSVIQWRLGHIPSGLISSSKGQKAEGHWEHHCLLNRESVRKVQCPNIYPVPTMVWTSDEYSSTRHKV